MLKDILLSSWYSSRNSVTPFLRYDAPMPYHCAKKFFPLSVSTSNIGHLEICEQRRIKTCTILLVTFWTQTYLSFTGVRIEVLEVFLQSGVDFLALDLVDGRVAPDRPNVVPVQFVLQHWRRLRYREALLRRHPPSLAQAPAHAVIPAKVLHRFFLALVDAPVVKVELSFLTRLNKSFFIEIKGRVSLAHSQNDFSWGSQWKQ